MQRLAVVSCVFALIAAGSASAQISGAIFTTDARAKLVNGNTYKKKTNVYLNGGPGPNAPCTAAGLPDGNYYFQVTNPSGKTLLSSDALADRMVVVKNGVITSASKHKTGKGICDPKARVVQLYPYDDTDNNGNEYKVWMTLATEHRAGEGYHGFIPKYSKTDNFKVQAGKPVAQSVIKGIKFYDVDEDGVRDANEPIIPGWRVEIWVNGQFQAVDFTNSDGQYCFIRPQDSTEYIIREVAPGGFIGDGIAGAIWLATTARNAKVLANADNVVGPSFGNLKFEVKVGVGRTKGFWHNNNGKALLKDCDRKWRVVLNDGLHLRNNVVSELDSESLFLVPNSATDTFEAAHDTFADWIVGNPAKGHAGFILSTQVAAAVLNRECGFMQFTTYVDVGKDGVLISFKDMVAAVKLLLCNPLAGLTGPSPTDPDVKALRDAMLACINEFGGVNDTGNLENDQVVYGPSLEPGDIEEIYEEVPGSKF